ncbi:hypothetical protein THAOC_09356, partial [Thalassiosira oceanica]
CTMEVAEGCIPDQNRPLVPILASAEAVAPAITDDFGLEVERRSTLHNYTGRRTPPIQISHSLEAILIVTKVWERQRSAHGDITGFEIRRFSNGDLHAADSQVNYKYVQMDVGTLTDSLSPNIHRSMAIASIIRFACFRLLSDHSLFNRVLPEGLLWQGLWNGLNRDPLRCASGVRGDGGVYPARPSALYTPTGPLGRSVASVDLKQPSMHHRRSSVCVGSNVLATQSQAVFPESRVTFAGCRRRRKPTIAKSGTNAS